jgi:hypothetical protein
MALQVKIASFLEVSGVGCQVSGKQNKKPETCAYPVPSYFELLFFGLLPAVRRIEKVLPHLVGVKCFVDYSVAVEFF